MTSDQHHLSPLDLDEQMLIREATKEENHIELAKKVARRTIQRVFHQNTVQMQGDRDLLAPAIETLDVLASLPEELGEGTHNRETVIDSTQKKLDVIQSSNIQEKGSSADRLSHALTILGLVIFQDLLSNGIPIPPKSKNSVTPPPDLQLLPADKINGYIAQVNEMTNGELSKLLAIPRNDIMQAKRVEEPAFNIKQHGSDIGI